MRQLRRTTGTFAVRRAIWPAGWVRWRTRTPPRKSGFPQPLKAMLSGFHLLWSLPVAHTEAGKIRGTRFGAVSCTKNWIFDSFFKGILRVHAGAPPQAAVHACTTRLGSFYCGWLVYVHPLCFEPLFSGQFLLGHPFRDLPISFPMMCHSMVYVSRSAKIAYFSRQRRPCLPLRSRTHTFLRRKVGLGLRRAYGGRKILRTLFRPRFP